MRLTVWLQNVMPVIWTRHLEHIDCFIILYHKQINDVYSEKKTNT